MTFLTTGLVSKCRIKKTAHGQLIAVINAQDLPTNVRTMLQGAGLSDAYLTDGNEIQLGSVAIVSAKNSVGYAYKVPDQVDVATVVKLTSEQPTASERQETASKDEAARAEQAKKESEKLALHHQAQAEKDERDRRQNHLYRIQQLEKYLIALRDRVEELEAKFNGVPVR